MPTNFDALLRYHVIDQCLQNHFRTWTWETLADECFKAMNEASFRSEKNTISQRTIENDIRIMKSDLLGYNAPIKRLKGRYFYADKRFCIRNATLSTSDIASISAGLALLKTYKGAPFFKNMESLLSRLEKQVQLTAVTNIEQIVQFENIPESAGMSYLEELLALINNRQCIKLSYKRFNSSIEKSYTFHPYYLKEYHNRWYVIGWYQEEKYVKTFALDRILSISLLNEIPYNLDGRPDSGSFFGNTIGVTYMGQPPQRVILKFFREKIPYIKTQALHHTQKIIEETQEHLVISLMLCINYELESLILSFSDEVEIIEPLELRNKIKGRLTQGLKFFSDI